MKEPIGRPVRIVSLCFREGTKSLSEIAIADPAAFDAVIGEVKAALKL